MKHSTVQRLRTRQSGVTMIEAMVALLVMSFGMVALVGLLSNLRQNADVAKQRSEAMRLAQSEIAKLRSFSVLNKGARTDLIDYQTDLLTPVESRMVTVENSNATFVLSRDVNSVVNNAEEPQAQTVSVTVSWKNRAGIDESLTLDTMIARIDPAFGTALSITPPTNGVRTSDGRNPVIPAGSQNLGNGSSAFRPKAGNGTVWIFNNATGVITGKCQIDAGNDLSALTPRDLDSCDNDSIGYLVSGTIQFSNTNPSNPTVPEAAAQSLTVYVALSPSQYKVRDSSGVLSFAPGRDYPPTPQTECFSDAPSSPTLTRTFVNYNCIVYPNSQTPRNWWGQVLLRDLDIGSAATQVKVCRYSADYNGNGYTYQVVNATEGTFKIDNEEHPETYRGVYYSLAKQNFLVIRGNVNCPTAPAVDQTHGVFADYSTFQVQPAVQPTP